MTDDIKTDDKLNDVSSDASLTYEDESLESKEEKVEYDDYGDPEIRQFIQKGSSASPMSTKKSKKLEKYEQRKLLRRSRRKMKKQARQEKVKALPYVKNANRSTRHIYSMANSTNKHTIVLDLSYEEFMNAKGMAKCANQVARSYSINRRCPNPVQLHLCSFKGVMKEEISKTDGYEKWDVHFHDKSYLNAFHPAKLVYLTSDASYILDTLDPDKIYVIGGFVDHNLHKGVSYSRARSQGLACARLPLDTNILLKTSPVLAINHVFEILLEVSNGATWRDAFKKVIPPRKIQERDVFKRHGQWHFHLDRQKREISENDNPEDEADSNSEVLYSNPEVEEGNPEKVDNNPEVTDRNSEVKIEKNEEETSIATCHTNEK